MDAKPEIADDRFEFSNTLQFNQQQHLELNGLSRGKKQPLLRACCALAGILMLFWSYTVLLGIILLVVTGLLIFAPQRLPGTDAWYYRRNRFYGQEIVYGVSDQGLSFTTEGVEAEIVWTRKCVWERRGELLRISSVNFPNCWYRISDLELAGVHDQVMDKCRQYGKQYKCK